MSDEELSRTAYLESRLPNLSTDEIFLASGDVTHGICSDQEPQINSQVTRSPIMIEEP